MPEYRKEVYLMKKNRELDRNRINFTSIRKRKNKVNIERDACLPVSGPISLPENIEADISYTAASILQSLKKGSPSIMAFGAHTIKNGLGPILIEMMRKGWLTHLATNGAGVIHDWEIAYQGQTSEDVKENVKKGKFGIWEETGLYINLALAVGAFKGLGYGESVGSMIFRDGLTIPGPEELTSFSEENKKTNPETAAAALDLLSVIQKQNISPGFMKIEHPWKKYSIQNAAYELGVNFTSHPMFGHDIIYTHPANSGAAVGRTAERDFLKFAGSISNLEGGVYLSVGSAVMSPMIFEKSLSMARNIALQKNSCISDFRIFVIDLAESKWDWEKEGEPEADDPAYYLRYCKTFSRMGGKMKYITSDNKVFLPALFNKLNSGVN